MNSTNKTENLLLNETLFPPKAKHCEDYITDKSQPKCLRKFLLFKRIPASWQCRWQDRGWPIPTLFATQSAHRGVGGGYKKCRRVRVTMASSWGDVGITGRLNRTHGYDLRVSVENLTDFSEVP